MKTDRHLYQLFRSRPDFLYELVARASPGPCVMEQITIKGIARTMDGLFRPADESQPILIAEFQFQPGTDIYQRTAIELASVQLQNPAREVQAVIVFGRRSDDPKSPPWARSIRAVYLEPALKKLERRDPGHPLVAVFRPLLVPSDTALEKSAARYYKLLKSSPLPPAQRDAFLEVFVDWLMQRFATRTRKEINTMIAELTPIEETVAGRELIDIGKERGIEIGLQQGVKQGVKQGVAKGLQQGMSRVVLSFAAGRFGTLEVAISSRIEQLSADELTDLSEAMSGMTQLSDLRKWLGIQKAR